MSTTQSSRRQSRHKPTRSAIIAREIALFDQQMHGRSRAYRAEERSLLLMRWDDTKAACYALNYGLTTGRATCEQEELVANMPAVEFAQYAIEVATTFGRSSINSIWAAWKDALNRCAAKRKV